MNNIVDSALLHISYPHILFAYFHSRTKIFPKQLNFAWLFIYYLLAYFGVLQAKTRQREQNIG